MILAASEILKIIIQIRPEMQRKMFHNVRGGDALFPFREQILCTYFDGFTILYLVGEVYFGVQLLKTLL